MSRFFKTLTVICFVVALASIVLFGLNVQDHAKYYFWTMVFSVALGLLTKRLGRRS